MLGSTLNFQPFDRSRKAKLRPLPKSPFEGRAATSLGFARVPPCITDANARAVLVWTRAREDEPGSQGLTASSSVGREQTFQRNLQFSKEAMARTSSFRRISHRSHCHGCSLVLSQIATGAAVAALEDVMILTDLLGVGGAGSRTATSMVLFFARGA